MADSPLKRNITRKQVLQVLAVVGVFFGFAIAAAAAHDGPWKFAIDGASIIYVLWSFSAVRRVLSVGAEIPRTGSVVADLMLASRREATTTALVTAALLGAALAIAAAAGHPLSSIVPTWLIMVAAYVVYCATASVVARASRNSP